MNAEEVLHGGVANAGAVVRVGPHVLRPSNAHTPSCERCAAAGGGGRRWWAASRRAFDRAMS